MAQPLADAGEPISNRDQFKPQSAEMLEQVESMLDYIRANLNNIRRTWGPASSQYKAASEIMHEYFSQNIKKLNIDVQEASLENLIAQLSLDEKNHPN